MREILTAGVILIRSRDGDPQSLVVAPHTLASTVDRAMRTALPAYMLRPSDLVRAADGTIVAWLDRR